jgi:hypothetical protein
MTTGNGNTTPDVAETLNVGAPETAVHLPLTVHEGHLIIEVGGRKALVDTGCPVTLGRGEALSIGGRHFELHDSFHGITVESVTEPVGYPFEILIGMDVLGEFVSTFSVKRAEVILRVAFEPEGDVLELGTWFGVPTMPITVNDLMHRVIFDTGAPTSYLSARLVQEFEFVGTRLDFFPLKGRFENDIHKVPVTIGSERKSFELAAMKGTLASMLEPSGMPGIIGTDLLRDADVTLSMASRTIVVGWHEAP